MKKSITKRINSLSGKLLLVSITCMVVPMLISSIYATSTSRNSLEVAAKEKISNESQGKKNQLDLIFKNFEVIAQGNTRDVFAKDFFKEENFGNVDKNKAKKIADELATQYKESNGLYENIFYESANGNIRIDGLGGESIKSGGGGQQKKSGDSGNATEANSKNDSKNSDSQKVIGNIIPGAATSTGKPVFGMMEDMKDNETNEKIGTFMLSVDLSNLIKDAFKSEVENSTNSFVIDDTGLVISSRDTAKILNFDFSKEGGDVSSFFEELKAKNSGIGYFTLEGVKYTGAFEKLETQNLYVITCVPESQYLSSVYNLRNSMYLVIIISILISSIIIILLSLKIMRPISVGVEYIKELASGDFTNRIPEKYKKSKDEIGLLMRNLDLMENSIKSIIETVVFESKNLQDAVKLTNDDISDLNYQIEDMSATTEEMSAGMEETAASAEEINASSNEIGRLVESIADKSSRGTLASLEIIKRAENLKENALNSQKSANEISISVKNHMERAIEQSKAVEKIDILTNSILEITSQTDLLALNAAIEAARAGEHGKGFAVVADEVRKLAENSKSTITEIQNVTKLVTSSVENLTKSSEEVLGFLDSSVVNDYKNMVDTGEQYYKDAKFIETLVCDFNGATQELNVSIKNMINAINEITSSNNESAQGTQNIAEKTSLASQKTEEILKIVANTKEVSEKLQSIVSQFRV